MGTKEKEPNKIQSSVFLTLFVTLIVTGIIMKRRYGMPEMVPVFHLPAAVFLVLGGRSLSFRFRRRYAESLTQLDPSAEEGR
jgi:cytochrome b subunit of formate dehydrogenase